jgi:hypothetical protein
MKKAILLTLGCLISCFSFSSHQVQLDSTFGINGQVYILVHSFAAANAMILQPDGKIVISQTTNESSLSIYKKQLSSGVYTYHLTDMTTHGSAKGKIVIF